jgi:cell division septum initiation protein DivIVA
MDTDITPAVDIPGEKQPNIQHMNTITNYTSKQLRLAADLKDQIEALEQELGQIVGSSTTPTTPSASVEPKIKRKRSAAVRAKMATAQRARWANLKGTQLPVKAVKKAKRTMSKAARARISLLAKARWAKAKAAGKSRL